jgi:Fe2+ or Zn2+ uptake regulation protein
MVQLGSNQTLSESGMNQASPSHETVESQDKDNYNFVQVSRGYLKEMRKLARKSPLGHEILYYLVEHMGKTTNAVVCSYRTICETTEASRASVGRAIKILKEDNWIDTIKVGNATAYCVNEKAFWQAGRNQRRYAIFSATVIASESEQDSDFKEKAKQKLTYVPIISSKERISMTDDALPPPDQKDLDLN